jgi:hypothetical protein
MAAWPGGSARQPSFANPVQIIGIDDATAETQRPAEHPRPRRSPPVLLPGIATDCHRRDRSRGPRRYGASGEIRSPT